jgi:hypothetical protein
MPYRPLVCTATIFNNFQIVPSKATIFEKFPYTIQIEILSFAPHYYDDGRPQISVISQWHYADQPKKNSVYVFTCLSCGGGGEKTGVEKLADFHFLTSQGRPFKKLYLSNGGPENFQICWRFIFMV